MSEGPEIRANTPEWAQRERRRDLEWIQENLPVLWPAARRGYQEQGRGAVVIDTTTVVHAGQQAGNPMFYVPGDVARKNRWGDVIRMVEQYDPNGEIVTVLLKGERESAYRVGLPTDK